MLDLEEEDDVFPDDERLELEDPEPLLRVELEDLTLMFRVDFEKLFEEDLGLRE